MATKAKASFSSCLSFLKDTLLLPTRNAKLFVPFLMLIAVPTFLVQILCINQINNKNNTSADFEKLVSGMLKEDMVLFLITISIIITIFILTTVVYGYAVQIIALFAASTTYSGDRHSLRELFSKFIIKGRHLKGPLITIVMVSVLNIVCKVLIALLSLLMPRRLGAPYTVALFSQFRSLMFMYLEVVFVVAVAVSVADTERRGVSALRQAWRLMTRVWKMGGCLLVVVATFIEMVPPPLDRVSLGYARKSMPMGLALFIVYALLSGLVQIFYYSAATVYYHQAMEIKEVIPHDYVTVVPSGEETTGTV
ncbi:hypothetical protein U9M48_012069 [Paspalum notatum var. saurae]|uniref:Uncharacterized protein n=1 Tax=Paspalum notatum var. saurae TaxID=547442 RepID=A0AAQ3WI76_PASNO